MERRVSAAEANRHFSRLMREVESGDTVIVTSRGEDKIVMSPVKARPEHRRPMTDEEWAAELERRKAAVQPMIDAINQHPVANAGRWTRDELYKRDPR